MQKYNQKKHILFLTLSLNILIFNGLTAQNKNLILADSLFKTNELSKSANLYEKELASKKENLNLPTLYLKLSYCYDKLANYPKAIYFLEEAYFVKPEFLILAKIKEISENQNFQGYAINQVNYLFSIYLRFYKFLILFAIVLGLYLLYFMYRRKKYLKLSHIIAYSFYLLFLIIIVNFKGLIKIAIVKNDYTNFRTEPSASISPKLKLNAGHKLYVIGEKDVWAKTIFEKEIFYIKKPDVYLTH